jgi:hypothetical protein
MTRRVTREPDSGSQGGMVLVLAGGLSRGWLILVMRGGGSVRHLGWLV